MKIVWDSHRIFFKGIDYREETFCSVVILLSASFLKDVMAGTPAAILEHEVSLDMKAMDTLKLPEWKDRSMGP